MNSVLIPGNVAHAVAQLNMIIETISAIQHEMLTLASQLPEYPVKKDDSTKTGIAKQAVVA